MGGGGGVIVQRFEIVAIASMGLGLESKRYISPAKP